ASAAKPGAGGTSRVRGTGRRHQPFSEAGSRCGC
ncbi:enoyl-CoA hydratase, partial [Mycobacterium tuberculosis]|nr:enoyl-CoA hydratase [Mycobacterium tuberculosis]